MLKTKSNSWFFEKKVIKENLLFTSLILGELTKEALQFSLNFEKSKCMHTHGGGILVVGWINIKRDLHLEKPTLEAHGEDKFHTIAWLGRGALGKWGFFLLRSNNYLVKM